MAENPSVLVTAPEPGTTVTEHTVGVLRGLRRFAGKQPVGLASGVILAVIILGAVASPLIAPYNPIEGHFTAINDPPDSEYLLGTDRVGRDVLSRVIYGARISLLVAFVAVLVGDTFGAMWGIASGYLGGKFDIYSQRIVELLLSFPTLILAMVLLLGLGAGVFTVIVAISITRIPLSVRVIRSVSLAVKENSYVEAARAIGASDLRIMGLHIAPQCLAPWLVLVTAQLGGVIVLEASLGFLGVGVPAPTATWGNMLGGAVAATLKPQWWLVIFPGVAITVTVLAFNLFGDSIRDALDPRLRGTT